MNGQMSSGVDLPGFEGQPQSSSRMLVIAVAIFILLMLVGGMVYYYMGKQSPDVTLYQLQASTTSPDIGGGGLIYSISQNAIAFPLSERVTAVLVQNGQSVKKGQQLLQLDQGQLNSSIQTLQANVAAAQTRLQQAQALGIPSGIISAEAELSAATASYNAAAAQLNNNFIQSGALVATADGVVTEIDISPGQIFQANTPLMVIQDETTLIVHAKIPVTYYGQVTAGQAAVITVAAIPNLNIAGKVMTVIPVSDPQTDTFEVWVQFDNNNANTRKLTPGMTAFVRLQTAKKGFVVPRLGIVDIDSAYPYVFVVDNTNTAHQQAVHVGARTEQAAVVDNGLKQDDRVVVVGQDQVSNDQSVRVKRVEKEPVTL
jgi:membrane fusion protein (multidrug efflux system)